MEDDKTVTCTGNLKDFLPGKLIVVGDLPDIEAYNIWLKNTVTEPSGQNNFLFSMLQC